MTPRSLDRTPDDTPVRSNKGVDRGSQVDRRGLQLHGHPTASPMRGT